MNLFFMYIRHIAKILFIFLFFAAVMFVSFMLFNLPLQAVLYPFSLCAFSGMIIMSADFFKFREKYFILDKAKRAEVLSDAALPDADTSAEKAYREIISALIEKLNALNGVYEEKYRDAADYYTLWTHQIKTPIAAMRLKLQKKDTPEARSLLADLFRIEQYAEMALAFIRIDSDSSDYVFREYSIDSIIRQAVKKFSCEFIGMGIKLSYTKADAKIITDEKWLLLVFEQILSNAIKYSKKGGEISIYMPDSETVCIKDRGIGISPEDLPRIFEKGFTGCNGRTDKRSSGLGLYLAKRVCDKLGTELRVESFTDGGTSVFIKTAQKKLRVE